jgi:hypothetical protein
MLLGACATTGPATDARQPEVIVRTKTIDTGCMAFKPIYVDKADVFVDGTAKQLKEHNCTGVLKCGWNPKAMADCQK